MPCSCSKDFDYLDPISPSQWTFFDDHVLDPLNWNQRSLSKKETIHNFIRLAHKGMEVADDVILDIILKKANNQNRY